VISSFPRLYKLVAGGNDFLVADARREAGFEANAEDARRACRRHFGAGADGLIVLGASSVADASFRLFNADGSSAAFSGNGARCAARLIIELDGGRPGDVKFETVSGIVAARARPRDASGAVEIEVDMAAPRDLRVSLRLPPGSPAPHADYGVVGVPYLAVPLASIDDACLAEIAPPLRRWKELPDGANVAFFEPPQAPDAPVRLRTWERGVEGETLSSGTGCAMVAVALALRDGGQDGERIVAFAPRSAIRMSVVVTRRGGAITGLRLWGDARFIGEILPGPDFLAADP
jgi:diaminopimelate epimerase